MKEYVHLASVENSATVQFKGSAYDYMKVSSEFGHEGVVRLVDGLYIPMKKLPYYGLVPYCRVTAKNLDEFYYKDDDEDEDVAACERDSLGDNWW